MAIKTSAKLPTPTEDDEACMRPDHGPVPAEVPEVIDPPRPAETPPGPGGALAVRDPASVEIVYPEGWVGARPSSLDGLQRFARGYVVAGLMPRGLDSPAAATMVLHTAIEVGMSFGNAARWSMWINNRIALWGDAPLSLVMRSGLLADIVESFEGEEGTDDFAAVCTVTRRGMSPHTWRFSVADATRAGLWGKAGPWKTSPRRMLQLRARGFALRDRFPDALGGLECAEAAERGDDEQAAETVSARIGALTAAST